MTNVESDFVDPDESEVVANTPGKNTKKQVKKEVTTMSSLGSDEIGISSELLSAALGKKPAALNPAKTVSTSSEESGIDSATLASALGKRPTVKAAPGGSEFVAEDESELLG